ncbi:MAG: hypothetical protein JW965_07335 [Bacteroidales bacterium]|nr:hypothetical protein [Bacteroidales bacterium]
MNRLIFTACIFMLFSGICIAQDKTVIWNDFIAQLKNREITTDQIRPMDELGDNFKPVLLGFLDSLRVQASTEDWEVVTEIIEQDDKLLFIFPWSTRFDKTNYCLTFSLDGSDWYIEHLEAIYIRLERYGDLPVSEFPDVDEQTKTWIRQETYWSYIIINFYLPLSKLHGKQYALNLLKDGGGYYMAAKTWVPFLPENKAFILYLCWEQSNLRGNDITLVSLNDSEAVLEMGSYFFALYGVTSHLKNLISYEDYKAIFETIWQDRAKYAGWELKIEYGDNYTVKFIFTR